MYYKVKFEHYRRIQNSDLYRRVADKSKTLSGSDCATKSWFQGKINQQLPEGEFAVISSVSPTPDYQFARIQKTSAEVLRIAKILDDILNNPKEKDTQDMLINDNPEWLLALCDDAKRLSAEAQRLASYSYQMAKEAE